MFGILTIPDSSERVRRIMRTEVSTLLTIGNPEQIGTAPNRSYHYLWSQRLGSIGFTVFVAIFLGHEWESFRPGTIYLASTIVLAVLVLMFILGLDWIAKACWSKLTVAHSRIVLRTPFRRSILPVSSIRGRRDVKVRSGPAVFRRLTVESNDPKSPTLEFASVYAFDDEFHRWFGSLPDLGSIPDANRVG